MHLHVLISVEFKNKMFEYIDKDTKRKKELYKHEMNYKDKILNQNSSYDNRISLMRF